MANQREIVSLKATVGIDSIHILIKMNKADIERFCNDRGLLYKDKNSLKYQRKWLIFLQNGEPITTTYHSRSRTMKFEIGKLMNYSINRNRYIFIQDLISQFSDRKQSVSRVDIAIDINKSRDDLMVKYRKKILSYSRIKSTTYFNSKGSVMIVYDKSQQLQIYSRDLTRCELRLNQQLTSWNVKDFMSNKESFNKLVEKVKNEFKENIELMSSDRLTRYILVLNDIRSVFLNFIEFMHGGQIPMYKDYFRISEAVIARDIFIKWMQKHKLTSKTISKWVKGRKNTICEELDINSRTLNKAIKFYKASTSFKFN